MSSIRELHLGAVTDADDPEQRGRVKATCDSLLPAGQELPDWIEPAFLGMAGTGNTTNACIFYPPTVGTIIELEVVVGDTTDAFLGQSLLDAPDIVYRLARYTDADTFPEVFKTNYGARRGISTPLGHYLVFDDTDGKGMVELFQADGTRLLLGIGPDDSKHKALLEHKSGAVVLIEEDGTILVTPASGKSIHLNDSAKTADGVARIGDATTGHDHTASFVLTADIITGVVSGNITIASNTDTIAEGSATVVAGD